MKSVGEVMAIGRTFPEVIQKALRMLDIGVTGLDPDAFVFDDLATSSRTPRRGASSPSPRPSRRHERRRGPRAVEASTPGSCTRSPRSWHAQEL
jgi:hypothetical protein